MLVNLSSLGLGSLSRRKTANLEDTLEQVADSLSGLLLLYRARKKRIELITELEAANEQDEQEIDYCRQQINFLMQKEEENHKRALAVVTSGSGGITGARLRGGAEVNSTATADELAAQYYWDDTAGESATGYTEDADDAESEGEEAYPDYEDAGTEVEVEDAALSSSFNSDYLPPAPTDLKTADAGEGAAELDLGDTDFSIDETLEAATETGSALLPPQTPTQLQTQPDKVIPQPSPADQELDELLAELDNLRLVSLLNPNPTLLKIQGS